MVNLLICAAILFYTARAVSFAVYTFREKNAAGGVSVLFLALLTFAAAGLYMIDVFK